MLMIYSKFKNKLYDVTYMWKIGGKRIKMDFFSKQKLDSQTENKLMVTKMEGRTGIKWEFGIKIHKLLYIKWITRVCIVAQW